MTNFIKNKCVTCTTFMLKVYRTSKSVSGVFKVWRVHAENTMKWHSLAWRADRIWNMKNMRPARRYTDLALHSLATHPPTPGKKSIINCIQFFTSFFFFFNQTMFQIQHESEWMMQAVMAGRGEKMYMQAFMQGSLVYLQDVFKNVKGTAGSRS